MRIEDVTMMNVGEHSDQELIDLRERSNQLFKAQNAYLKQVKERTVGVSASIPRDTLLESYSLITNELKKRGAEWNPTPLDDKLLRKRLKRIDVGELPPILVQSSVVCLSGDFVHNPKTAVVAAVRIDADQFGDDVFCEDLQKRMRDDIQEQTTLGTSIHVDATGLIGKVVPLYDLVLMPRDTTVYEDSADLAKRLNLRSKRLSSEDSVNTLNEEESTREANTDTSGDTATVTYTSKQSEHTSEQKEAGQFSDFRRQRIEDGVFGVYGILGGKSKVQSVRFDASKFTIDEAGEWLKSHGMKPDVQEAVTKTSFVKAEEQRICGGIVYAVNQVDSQGDFIGDNETIWEALKHWMIKAGGQMKFMHEGQAVMTPIVECFQAETDTMKGGQKIPAGAWYLANYIPEEYNELWLAIKSGAITGYSMAGVSGAEMVDVTEE